MVRVDFRWLFLGSILCFLALLAAPALVWGILGGPEGLRLLGKVAPFFAATVLFVFFVEWLTERGYRSAFGIRPPRSLHRKAPSARRDPAIRAP